MNTNQNIQKDIKNPLMRIFTVLITLVALFFHVWNTPIVLAEEQQTLEEVQIHPVRVLIEMNSTLKQEKYKVQQPLESTQTKKMTHDLWYAEGLLCRITTTAYSAELHEEVVKILDETNGILEKYPNSIPNIHAYYKKQEQELARYDSAIKGASEKLEKLKISKDMDISQVMGFTADELEQILLNARDTQGNQLIIDNELARELAEGIVKAVETYPVNEMAVIGIMSFETGHFTAPAVVNHHNYAGDKVNGEIMHFETDAEGISKGVKYIYNNMIATGPSIRAVNMRYCEIDPPLEEETEQEKEERVYRWANKVVSSMRMYAKIER